MWDRAQFLEVGFIARAHGVQGEVRVGLFNADSTALDEVERVYLVRPGDATPREVAVAGVRPTSDAVLVALDGVDDRNAAEALKGHVVLCRRADLAPLAAGEIYVADLVGCTVVTTAGQELGTVADILEAGPHDTLVIRDAACERMLPFVPVFVLDVDLAARRILADPPEGLPEAPLPARG